MSTGGNAKVVAEVTAATINCCKLVRVHNVPYLVVGSSAGMQVWCGNGEVLKFFSPLSSLIEEGILQSLQDNNEPVYMKGIAVAGESFIVMGCSTGHVFAIEVPSSSNGEDMCVAHTLGPLATSSPIQSGSSIVAVGGSADYAVCANEYGDIILLDACARFKLRGAIEPCGVHTAAPSSLYNGLIMSLLMRDNTIVAGYNTGHIRIFRANLMELAIEITAHSRCILSLALHPTDPLFASCGEDQMIHVWEFPTFVSKAKSDCGVIHSEYYENKMCTGVYFNRDELDIAAYDDDHILILEKTH